MDSENVNEGLKEKSTTLQIEKQEAEVAEKSTSEMRKVRILRKTNKIEELF